MNWNNLKTTTCPSCSSKLQFRRRGITTKIRARRYSDEHLRDDFYFCFKCNFQIKLSRFNSIVSRLNDDAENVIDEILKKVNSKLKLDEEIDKIELDEETKGLFDHAMAKD